jgi:hypothetical protein
MALELSSNRTRKFTINDTVRHLFWVVGEKALNDVPNPRL